MASVANTINGFTGLYLQVCKNRHILKIICDPLQLKMMSGSCINQVSMLVFSMICIILFKLQRSHSFVVKAVACQARRPGFSPISFQMFFSLERKVVRKNPKLTSVLSCYSYSRTIPSHTIYLRHELVHCLV